jgi:hypothetical protein
LLGSPASPDVEELFGLGILALFLSGDRKGQDPKGRGRRSGKRWTAILGERLQRLGDLLRLPPGAFEFLAESRQVVGQGQVTAPG